MTAATVFSIANFFAMAGWLILAGGVIFNRPYWRDQVAGTWWPLALSALYAFLILFFFFKAPGGFETLANVQLLFTAPWAALAGWIHYLAFDLFIGAWIARHLMQQGISRWWLLLLLPATFLFGPMGLVGLMILKTAFASREETP